MNCKHIQTEPVCFDNGTTKQQLVAHYEYANNAAGAAILVSTRYTLSDGLTVVDTSGGSVSVGACSVATIRTHENFVITGATPLVIPAGAVSISITKTSTQGIVNISGDNSVNFPLNFNRENFTDSVNEEVSVLTAYAITGTTAATSYKVHIIR